jgi:hypothetical protein
MLKTLWKLLNRLQKIVRTTYLRHEFSTESVEKSVETVEAVLSALSEPSGETDVRATPPEVKYKSISAGFPARRVRIYGTAESAGRAL